MMNNSSNSKAIMLQSFSLENVMEGTFISRPNRFTAEIEYKNEKILAHVHDPGRLKELLVKKASILFTYSSGKLPYYIKAVKAEEEWVLIDSSLHSKIAEEIFQYIPALAEFKTIKREVTYGKSRIDFSLDGIPLEVKGCTLVINNEALFPDAPTKRGTRHVKEIIRYKGMILFLIFRKADRFIPYRAMDLEFTRSLSNARKLGISIIPVRISFDGINLFYEGTIPLGDF